MITVKIEKSNKKREDHVSDTKFIFHNVDKYFLKLINEGMVTFILVFVEVWQLKQ